MINLICKIRDDMDVSDKNDLLNRGHSCLHYCFFIYIMNIMETCTVKKSKLKSSNCKLKIMKIIKDSI